MNAHRAKAWRDELRSGGVPTVNAGLQHGAWLLPEEIPALAVVDLPPEEALSQVREIRRAFRHLPIVLVVDQSSEQLAIEALRAGVTEYLRSPLEPGALARVARSFVGEPSLPSGDSPIRRLLGPSAEMSKVREQISRASSTSSNILITGETGTGKELAAELIHISSARSGEPFVSFNCAAIPEGLLESELFGYEKGAYTGAGLRYDGKLKLADHGTVFFDEIGELSPQGQAKLLRVIELKEAQRLGSQRSVQLNVRVVAATNQDLDRLSTEGKFRRDLYYRLNVVRIHMPALRARSEDIPELIAHYLAEYGRQLGGLVEGFTPEAMERLMQYSWPGNIRELKNLIESVSISCRSPQAGLADLPEHFRWRLDQIGSCHEEERGRILAALRSTEWNKTKAAGILHWSRMTLYRKMAKHQMLSGRQL